MAHNYSALPDAGGLYDQDARTMNYMSTLGSVYHAVKRIRGAKGEAIHNLSDDDRATWQKLIDLGVMD